MTRTSGILLPLFSLPSPYGIGTLGREALRWIDLLHEAGQTYWQILPLGITGPGDSPYQSQSSFAGNPYFIDLDALAADKLLDPTAPRQFSWGANPHQVDYGALWQERTKILHWVWDAFKFARFASIEEDFEEFKEEAKDWLDEFVLYRVIKASQDHQSWLDWPSPLRDREPSALKSFAKDHADEMEYERFIQFLFFRQWATIRAYAKEKEILLLGDLPMYCAEDSADVWAHRELFLCQEDGLPDPVAAIPPDAFSDEGQFWGNPLYDWEAMKKDGYQWWLARIRQAMKLYDVVRLDHFLAFQHFYALPREAKTTTEGAWHPGPGLGLFEAIKAQKDLVKPGSPLPFLAEDLGLITPEVKALKDALDLPGMAIMEFAFDSDATNPYLPHLVDRHTVYYSGTHDNETFLEFMRDGQGDRAQKVKTYLGLNGEEGWHWGMIRALWTSQAETVILPFQDFRGLRGDSRINIPGQATGNWTWRFGPSEWPQDTDLARLKTLTEISGRLRPHPDVTEDE